MKLVIFLLIIPLLSFSQIHIKTVEDFLAIEKKLDAYYVLDNNLDFGGMTIKPIGSDYMFDKSLPFDDPKNVNAGFKGILEGNKFTISNFKVSITDKTEYSYAGLFAIIVDARIRNLNIKKAVVKASSDYAGVLAGQSNNSVISDVQIESKVDGKNRVGGIVGANYGIIKKSNFSGIVSGISFVGGVTGENFEIIDTSYSKGSVFGEDANIGGITGYNDGQIMKCFSQVAVSGNHQTGGVVGSNFFKIAFSYSKGATKGVVKVGGIAGSNHGTIISTYSEGSVTSINEAGGIAGFNYGQIAQSFSQGEVFGSGNYVGGVAGYSEGVIKSSYSMGNISGVYYTGGVAGYSQDKIENVYSSGVISGTNNTGGVVGINNYGTVKKAYSKGTILGNFENTGGVVGLNYGDVSYSYALGDITANGNYTGGLVGQNENGNIALSYFTKGKVNGKKYTGGLIGMNKGGHVFSVYSNPKSMKGSSHIGALIGLNTDNEIKKSVVENAYYPKMEFKEFGCDNGVWDNDLQDYTCTLKDKWFKKYLKPSSKLPKGLSEVDWEIKDNFPMLKEIKKSEDDDNLYNYYGSADESTK